MNGTMDAARTENSRTQVRQHVVRSIRRLFVGGFETRARVGTVDLPCGTVTDCARAVLMLIHKHPPQTPSTSANEPATQK